MNRRLLFAKIRQIELLYIIVHTKDHGKPAATEQTVLYGNGRTVDQVFINAVRKIGPDGGGVCLQGEDAQEALSLPTPL